MIQISGGPMGGRSFETLSDLIRAANCCDRGRETYRIWGRDLDTVYFMAKREGLCPPMSVLPGHGVTGFELAPRVQLRSARPVLPDDALEAMAARGDTSAADGLAAVRTAMDALDTALGVNVASGIGAATTAALFGGRWMPRYTAWPEDMPAEAAALCHDAYHGGMQRVFYLGGILEHGAAAPGPIWETEEAATLPEGWRLLDIDRDSAYAEDAAGFLPDCLSDQVTSPLELLNAPGGAVVEARVDLEHFTGLGFPVRIEVAPGVRRGICATYGAWRSVWCSDLLLWAQERGAVVEVLSGIGWSRSARFLGPMMDRLWNMKNTTSGLERDVYKAAIQRAVGRLGRRHYGTVTLCGAEAKHAQENPQEWPEKWKRVHGMGHGYFVADSIEEPEGLPRGVMPPWPAFVVSRAWIKLATKIEELAGRGCWPIYCDTDGVLVACPADVDPCEGEALRMGGWRVKRRFSGAEHRAARQFVRLREDGEEELQFAGIPKRVQRDALMGAPKDAGTETALLDLQASFRQAANRLAPVLAHTKPGVDRAKRVGRNAAKNMEWNDG